MTNADATIAVNSELAARDDMIISDGVDKWYGDFQALKGVTATIKEKEVVVVLGPSGSGKSTLARLLYRFYDVQRGRVAIFKLDDKTEPIEAVASEELLNAHKDLFKDDELIIVLGKVQPDRFAGGLRLNVQQLWDLPAARARFGRYLTVAINGSGNVVFTPASNFGGPASFTYTVTDDDNGSASDTAVVTVMNLAPTATALSPASTRSIISTWPRAVAWLASSGDERNSMARV